MKKRTWILAGILGLFGLGVVPSPADVVHLKDGRRLDCKVVKETESVYVLEVGSMRMTMERSRVDSIEREAGNTQALIRAKALENSGKYLEAIAEYRTVRDDPATAQESLHGERRCREAFRAEFRKANAELFAADKYDQLDKILESSVAAQPITSPAADVIREFQSELLIERAHRLIDRMDPTGAEKALVRAVLLAPNSAQAHYELGHQRVRMEEWADAVNPLQRSLDCEDPPGESKLLLMKAYFNLGDTARGLAAYEQMYAPGATPPCDAARMKQYQDDCAYFIGRGYKERALAIAAEDRAADALAVYKYGAYIMPDSVDGLQQDVAFYRRMGAEAERKDAESRLEIARQNEESAKEILSMMASASAFAPTATGGGASGGKITANSLSSALERARQNNRRVLLIFCTDWCGFCKKLKRDILPGADVRAALGGYVLTELDAEKGEGKSLARRYGVSGYPTLIVMDSSGQELKRMSGCPQTSAALAGWLR